MRGLFYLITACGLLATTVGLCIEKESESIQEISTKKTFPKEISFENKGKTYTVQLTGTAVRKKFFVNVYTIAHYLENPPSNSTSEEIFRIILSDNKAKQLTMHWTRDVSVQKVKDAFQESFHKVISEQEFASIQKEIDQFLGFYQQDVHSGNQHEIRWIPGGIIEVILNEESKGTITNPGFAKALWSIWLGPKSILNRDQLIALIQDKNGSKQ